MMIIVLIIIIKQSRFSPYLFADCITDTCVTSDPDWPVDMSTFYGSARYSASIQFSRIIQGNMENKNHQQSHPP